MKINYQFKAEVLKTDIPKLANQIAKTVYAQILLEQSGEIIKTNMDYDTAIKQRCFLLEKYPKEYAEAEKINKARYKRVVRLRERISKILHNCETVIFLTLTFNDEILKKTTVKTRRQYVRRYLTASNFDYVANIDFGKKNGREHYHAVVGGCIDVSKWNKYGFSMSEQVRLYGKIDKIPKKYAKLNEQEQQKEMQADNEKRLSKYISKLTNHAIKETTKRNVCIYSSPKKSH